MERERRLLYECDGLAIMICCPGGLRPENDILPIELEKEPLKPNTTILIIISRFSKFDTLCISSVMRIFSAVISKSLMFTLGLP
jgi:hypothetical protein